MNDIEEEYYSIEWCKWLDQPQWCTIQGHFQEFHIKQKKKGSSDPEKMSWIPSLIIVVSLIYNRDHENGATH